MSEHMSPIPSRVYNAAVGGHVCGPEDVDFGQKVVHLIKYDRAGNEVSFESQVTQANKIYVIHDDFTLSSNVTIPANCVLEFDGGSIDCGSYTISGNKMPSNVVYNPEQFGAGKTSDDTKSIQSVLNLCKYVRMDGSYNVYSSDDSQNYNPALWVKSDTDIELNGSIHLKSTTFTDYSVLFLKDVDGIRIHGNGKIEGDKLIHTAAASEHGSCIALYRSSNIIIDGIELYNANGDGVYFSWWETKSSNVLIQNVYIHDVRRHGIAPLGNNITIKNFRIENCFGATQQSDCGIDIENDEGGEIGNILVDTGIIKNCKLGIASGGGQTINNVLITNVKCIKDTYPSTIVINQYCVIEDCEADTIQAHCDCLIKNCTVNTIAGLTKNGQINPTIIDNCTINSAFMSQKDSTAESGGVVIIKNSLLNIDCTTSFKIRNSFSECQFKFYNCTLNLNGSYTGNFNYSELYDCTLSFTNVADCGITAYNSYIKVGLAGDDYGVFCSRTATNLISTTIELGNRDTPLWRLDYGDIKVLNSCIIDPITGRQRSVYSDYTLTEAGNTYIENNQVVQ